MSNWKNAERQAAKLLGGTRRVRINYSESCEDVHHTRYAIEVKYGKQVPEWVGKIKGPVLVNGLLILFPLGSSSSGPAFEDAKAIYRKKIGFIIDGMIQAHGYTPEKRPLLLMKRPRQQGLTACMYILDYMNSEFMVQATSSQLGASTVLSY